MLRFEVEGKRVLGVERSCIGGTECFNRDFSSLIRGTLPRVGGNVVVLSERRGILRASKDRRFIRPSVRSLIVTEGAVFYPRRRSLRFRGRVCDRGSTLFMGRGVQLQTMCDGGELLFKGGVQLLE